MVDSAAILNSALNIVNPSGHIVCNECKPSLVRCPICDIRYRSAPTRDFFAEKLLDHLERRFAGYFMFISLFYSILLAGVGTNILAVSFLQESALT